MIIYQRFNQIYCMFTVELKCFLWITSWVHWWIMTTCWILSSADFSKCTSANPPCSSLSQPCVLQKFHQTATAFTVSVSTHWHVTDIGGRPLNWETSFDGKSVTSVWFESFLKISVQISSLTSLTMSHILKQMVLWSAHTPRNFSVSDVSSCSNDTANKKSWP